MKILVVDGNIVKIGNNSKENSLIIKENDNPKFYWFHLSSFPSCHLIIETEVLTDSLIFKCAKLCKKHTKYRNVPNVYVEYTRLNNIILNKHKEGEVFFKSNKKIKKILI